MQYYVRLISNFADQIQVLLLLGLFIMMTIDYKKNYVKQ